MLECALHMLSSSGARGLEIVHSMICLVFSRPPSEIKQRISPIVFPKFPSPLTARRGARCDNNVMIMIILIIIMIIIIIMIMIINII